MSTKQSFESALLQFSSNKDCKQVFRDFLSLTLSIYSINPSNELQMEIYSRYDGFALKDAFPKILDLLLSEMELRKSSQNGNDILGEFCQKYYYNKNEDDKQILSWAESNRISLNSLNKMSTYPNAPIEFLDVGCRSGRIMIASHFNCKSVMAFYGVEYDCIYIMISCLNLFFNNCRDSEVLWVDQERGNTFKESYLISPFPLGITRNLDGKRSKAWLVYQMYLDTKKLIRS